MRTAADEPPQGPEEMPWNHSAGRWEHVPRLEWGGPEQTQRQPPWREKGTSEPGGGKRKAKPDTQTVIFKKTSTQHPSNHWRTITEAR